MTSASASEHQPDATVPTKWLLTIFALAVAVRWLYSITLFAAMGPDGIMSGDSFRYLSQAQTFAQAILNGSVSGWGWLGLDLDTMPLFSWLVTINVIVLGNWAALSYVLLQGLLDGAACIVIAGIANEIDERLTLPAAIIAAFNPTQIVLSGLLYTDTPFLFFAALSLWALACWLKSPSWKFAIIAGAAAGVAVHCRALMVPWIVVVVAFMLTVIVLRRRAILARIGQTAAMAAIFVLCIAPVLLRNVTQHGAWTLTPQSGVHLALWVVPLVEEAHRGTPWSQGSAEMQQRTIDKFGPQPSDQFESSRQFTEVAIERLKALGVMAIAKAWVVGTAINLATPALILSPPVAQLPRTGFFATPGTSVFEKIARFLFKSDNPLYGRLLLLVLWCLYILGINGPVASPKYRLPLEPVLVVMAAAGFCALRSWHSARRSAR